MKMNLFWTIVSWILLLSAVFIALVGVVMLTCMEVSDRLEKGEL